MHDAAVYLRAAVSSAIEQEGPESEVVVYDDASTDNSAEVAEELARQYAPRVRVLRGGQNRGVSVARNRACEAAAAEMIAFLDADDAFLPGHLRRSAEILEAGEGTALTFGRAVVVRESDDSGRPAPPAWTSPAGGAEHWGGAERPGTVPDAFRLLLRANIVPTSTVVCRRSAWREAGGFETGLAFQQEDHLLWTRIAYRHAVHDVGVSAARYRVHARSYSARKQNEATASAREIEYLQRMQAWVPEADVEARRALAEAWDPVAQRVLYRLYRCLRAADGRGAWREARALLKVPHKRSLLSAPRRWREARALMGRPSPR